MIKGYCGVNKMGRKNIKIYLNLKQREQQARGYTNPAFEWDFNQLLLSRSTFSVDDNFRDELIRAIEKSLLVPEGFLDGYTVTYLDNVLLVQ